MLYGSRTVSRQDEDIDLSQFEEDYQRATTWDERPQAETVPDGFYDVRIEEVRLSRAVNSGNPMVVWRLRILGPNCENRILYKRRAITSRTVGFLKDDLFRCGLPLERLSELQERLGDMQNTCVGVFKKTRNGWEDIHFARREREESPLNDDLPF